MEIKEDAKKVMIIISDLPNLGNNGMSECIFLTITEVPLEIRKNYLLLFERDFSNFLGIFLTFFCTLLLHYICLSVPLRVY